MAFEQVVEGLEVAITCGATSLAGKLHYLMKLHTDGTLVLAAAASDKIIGVLREEAVVGDPATVQYGGIGKVIAGGTVAPGDLLTSDGSGKAIATTSTGNRIVGIALTAADANDIFSFAVLPGSV